MTLVTYYRLVGMAMSGVIVNLFVSILLEFAFAPFY